MGKRKRKRKKKAGVQMKEELHEEVVAENQLNKALLYDALNNYRHSIMVNGLREYNVDKDGRFGNARLEVHGALNVLLVMAVVSLITQDPEAQRKGMTESNNGQRRHGEADPGYRRHAGNRSAW